MSFKEPQPRAGHAAVGAGQKLYIWGGDSSYPIQATTIDTFDVPSLAWQEPQELCGSQPRNKMWGMAVATNGETAYFFGGKTESNTYSNTLFKIELSTLLCEEINHRTFSTAPKEKFFSCMLYFDEKLVVHGGYTSAGEETEELHIFDLRTSECAYISAADPKILRVAKKSHVEQCAQNFDHAHFEMIG